MSQEPHMLLPQPHSMIPHWIMGRGLSVPQHSHPWMLDVPGCTKALTNTTPQPHSSPFFQHALHCSKGDKRETHQFILPQGCFPPGSLSKWPDKGSDNIAFKGRVSHAKTQAEGKASPKRASYLPPLGSPQPLVITKSMGKKGFFYSSHHPKFTRSICAPAPPAPLPPQSTEPPRTSLKPLRDLDPILRLLIGPCCDNEQDLMVSLPHFFFGGSQSHVSHFILFSAFFGDYCIVHHVPWFSAGSGSQKANGETYPLLTSIICLLGKMNHGEPRKETGEKKGSKNPSFSSHKSHQEYSWQGQTIQGWYLLLESLFLQTGECLPSQQQMGGTSSTDAMGDAELVLGGCPSAASSHPSVGSLKRASPRASATSEHHWS